MAELLKKPELLIPAGDAECLAMALQYGADAVYLGAKTFGMRASAKNFDFAAMAQAVQDAHAKGVKVYLTVNVMPRCHEMDQMPDFLREAAACGIDAVIAADLGVITTLRSILPDLPVHASTQTGIVNYATATALWNMGVERVVLARELSLEEIAEIRAKTPPQLALETFVHGAMCMSVSGRCLLSEYFTGRDANRGACAQSCRWRYHLVEEKRPGQYFPIGETEEGSYILNAKDLCMLPYLKELYQAGVTSLKIEGRAKSFYYVAGMTNAYRAAIDALFADPPKEVPTWVMEELEAVSHRPYTTGFYFGRPDDSIHNATASYVRTTEVIGIVQDWREGRLYLSQRNRFFAGDAVSLLCPHEPPRSFCVQDLQNGEGESIASANHAMMDCSVAYPEPVPKGAILRKAADEERM
ncbi:MAG: U32 family peptidase [Oscillospiraceae bacterium]|nr:U32 family peptidase [Oscillospiraceae bacterium]